MTSNTIKSSIIGQYGKLAQNIKKRSIFNRFACCNTKDTVHVIGEAIGYTQDDLNQVPTDANLGVGCGNPAALAKMKVGETVVDLGSGAGFDAFLVAPVVGASGKVIGVDLSDDMLALARRNAKQGDYSHVSFVRGDIEDLPLEEEMADHVISNCVINLSQNKGDVFKEAFRVLKPGGQLSISDIVLEKELPGFITKLLAGHFACMAGAEKWEDYVKYIEAAGFKDIKIEKKGKFPLELMLMDPQLKHMAKTMNLDIKSEKAKQLAARVSSITLSARK